MKPTLARLERRLEELASVKAPLDEDKPQLRPIRTMAERTAGDSCEAPHTCYGGSAV